MTPAGRLQTVQTVDTDDEDDSASDSSSSGPPPLMGANSDEEADDEASETQSVGDADSVPELMDNGTNSELSSEEEEEDSEGPPSASGSDNDEPPALAGSSDDGSAHASEEGEDELPPELDDPDESEAAGSESLSDEDNDMPQLEVEDDDSEQDDSDSDQQYNENYPQKWGQGMKSGFLRGKQDAAGSSAHSYSKADVGQREEGPAAAARRQRSAADRSSAPYAGAGAGSKEDLRGEHPYNRSSGRASSSRAAEDAAGGTGKPDRWYQSEKHRKKPEPQPAPAPVAPAEVVVDRGAIEAREREYEERRRQLQMMREETNTQPVPVGRCCLNRGLADEVRHCLKDPIKSLVWPPEKRMQMRCSAGCGLMWHMECWRRFQDDYEKETRGSPGYPNGVNITQALKVRDKTKLPVVYCVTPGCPGYITFLGSFEGPVGHETFKSTQYQPTQDNLAAIKEAEAADKAAAKAAVDADRAACKAAAEAAALAAWRKKTNWKPKGPQKPRNKQPKPQQEQQQQNRLASGRAAAGGSDAFDEELMRMIGGAGKSAAGRLEQQDSAAAPAEAAADGAHKSKGIQIKVRAINVVRAAAPPQQQQQQSHQEDNGPSSPSAASLEGSTSQATSLAQAEVLSQLSRPSDHADPTYHASLEDILATEASAGTGAKGKGKKAKKGVKMHISELQTLTAAEEFAESNPNQRGHHQQGAAGSNKGPAAATGGRQQQQQQRRPINPGDFPTLDQAAAAGADEYVVETDYLAEALSKLKLGLGDARASPYVLLECVDFYMISKQGDNPETAIKQLVYDKCSVQPLCVWLFERQEAAAVLMPDEDTAWTLHMACCSRIFLHRKQIQSVYLRDAPDDHTLHEVCPDYWPPGWKERAEMEETMAALKEQTGGAAGEQLSKQKMDELAQQVKDGKLDADALMQRIEQLKAGANSSSAAAASSSSAAKISSSSSSAAEQKVAKQQTKQQQQQAAAAVLAVAGATSSAAAAPASRPVPPPRPPPGNPPTQQQAHNIAAAAAAAATAASAAYNATMMMQPTMMQPTMIPGYMGYGVVPVMQPVMQPLVMVQPPPQQAAMTWQQQQHFGPGAYRVRPYQQQRQQQQQQWSGTMQRVVDADGSGAWGHDGDWQEDWEEGGAAGEAIHGWDGGRQVQVEAADDDEDEEEGQPLQQQLLQARLEARGRSSDAAGGAGASERSMSGSPGNKKLNPLAKEFRIPNTSSAAAPSSRLQAGSSSSSATAPASSSTGGSSVAPSSSSASSATSPAASGSSSAATTSNSSPSAVSSRTSDAGKQTEQAAASSKQAAAAAAAAGTAAGSKVASSAADKPEASAVAPADAQQAAASAGGGSSRSTGAGATRASRQSSTGGTEQQQQRAAVPTRAAQPELPADHVFDVVHLLGCQTEHLNDVYRNPGVQRFMLQHAYFVDSHKFVTSESAGLIMFNNETMKVEGLWAAVDNSAEGITWQAVADYINVPAEVYTQVLQFQPYKQRYDGPEALAITKALWKWKHPAPAAPLAAAAAAAAATPTPALPPAGPQAGGGSGGGSSAGPVTGAAASAAAATTQQHPASAPNSRPGSSGAGSSGAGGGRALPPLLAMLANRPGSSGAGSGNAGAAAAAAGPPPSSKTQPPAAAAAPPRPQPGRHMCTVCGLQPSGWLVWDCKHMGPCSDCCQKPADMEDKFYKKPPEYPTCRTCQKPVGSLFRVVM